MPETTRPSDATPRPSNDRVPTYRGPLQGLYDLSQLLGGETPESRRFLRGLAVGALVGAAVAGSSLLRRRRRREPGTGPGGGQGEPQA